MASRNVARWSRRAGIALLALLAAGAAQAKASAAQSSLWWSHVTALAGDDTEGRMTGSRGYDKAADYVAAQFKRYGLQPADAKGYLQPVRFKEQQVRADRSSVALVAGGEAAPVALGPEMILGSRVPQPQAVEAPLVFIGYGLFMPQARHDDFAGMDLKGKIAVAINGGPAELPGPMKSSARSSATWRQLERAGAVGLITIPTPKGMDIPWARQMVLASQPGMYLADPELQETGGPRFTATLNPEAAAKLFARSGRDFAEVLALAEAGKPVPRFDLNLSLRAKVSAQTRNVTSPNIAGLLPGSDPLLARDYVLVSAHLDHLGIGQPINGDKVYNGAMDDASGVATVLETARIMSAAPTRPKRSMLFVVFTAEEKGLLGSRAFAERPSVGREAVVADLNLDMFLPLWPLKHLLIQGADESSLGAEARAVAAERGYELIPDPYPDRNSFVRTDQYSFVRAGVPALSLKFGFALGSPEQQMEREWRTNRYHAPSDDLAQPVDLKAADDFNAYLADLARRIADQDQRPAWRPDSIFAPPAPRAQEGIATPLEMPIGRRPQKAKPGYG